MTFRPSLATDPADAPRAPRQSKRVAWVAEHLDMHPGDVRRLVDRGELEAHGTGVRGIRVFLDSVADYQERQAKSPKVSPTPIIHKPKARSAASTAAFRAAMAGLRAKGLA